ncbi:MAG: ABC transporter substrate-binding protein [Treponema sp.]|nr:ABC transporter substrate-binding protein [Treponema sp.]MCL2245241.1 ABC transporter substrate-binding protein [Treponema sp.]
MKNLRRIITLSLIILLAGSVIIGCKKSETAAGGGATGKPTAPQGRLVIGVNAMNGNMFDGWDNLGGNADIKLLINGYKTIIYTDDDRFIVDPVVVKSMNTTENADGGKTYTFEINNNLTWNDGTPITAKDYVFALLLDGNPLIRELGTNRWVSMDTYYGFEAYNEGDTNIFSGVRLLGNYEFSVRIAHEDSYGDPLFPFWYEITYADVTPFPLHVLAPGCDVVDRGTGAEITGPFTLELLQSTIDNGSRGYRYTPYVTAAPYKFVSYDVSNNTTILEANERYLGLGSDRIKPMIKTLVLQMTEDSTQMDMLGSGTIDLLVQLSGARNINPGLDLVDTGRYKEINYARNGYGCIWFQCDWGPAQFPAVRRAIAYSMDREEFVRQYTGGYGVIVHSRIGLAQWMYAENKTALERDLTVYTLNLQKAAEELVADGWTLNAQGGAYTTGVRYKRLSDGTLMPLIVEWFSNNLNTVGEMLATFVTANAASIGMQINQDFGDVTAFYNALDGIGKRYNMINGGSGFAIIDSPWYYYQPDPEMFGSWNGNFLIDHDLNRYTQNMRNTTPGDYASFSRSWMEFVLHFNKNLPDLPLYSDQYYDIFNNKLQGYNHNALYPWTSAIVEAWVSE